MGVLLYILELEGVFRGIFPRPWQPIACIALRNLSRRIWVTLARYDNV